MYLGPASIEDIARQVVQSRGPSGCNTEYVINLATAMQEIAPSVNDEHLFALDRKIREMAAKTLGPVTERDKECTCNFCHLITGRTS